MSRTYLDWNATAPLRPEARAAMLDAMDVVGNPSSVHAEGRAAKGLVERARGQVADLVGCDPSEVVFTSGATEAAALALRHAAPVVLISENCHDCLYAHVDEKERRAAPVDRRGLTDAAWLDHEMHRAWTGAKQMSLVGHSFANSETGVLEMGMIRRAILDNPATLISDITQAVHRTGVSIGQPWNTLALMSAHKIGGPKGVGALIVRSGTDLDPAIKGGGQEMGRRSGTENVIGIAGFGAAADAALRDLQEGVWDGVEKLRNILESALYDTAPDIIFVGSDVARLPNTSCFAMPGWKGETQVMQMDLAGYAISAGSACSSGKVKESRVLRAMGFDSAVAASAIRVSLGPTTTEDEVLGFARTWTDHYRRWQSRAA